MKINDFLFQNLPQLNIGNGKEGFNYLNKKIDHMTQLITQGDLYKINYVLTDPALIQSAAQSLLPNTAMVIDTPVFSGNGVTYYRGDLIFKDSYETTTHIEAARGSTYAPIKIVKKEKDNKANANYEISYQKVDYVPLAGQKTLTPVSTDKELIWENKDLVYKEMNFINFPDMQHSTLYQGDYLLNSINRSITFDLREAEPIIRYYRIKDGIFEEVYWDENKTISDGKMTISGIPDIISKVVVK